MAYDTTHGQVILYARSQAWAWNGSVWTELATLPVLHSRSNPTMGFDARRCMLVLFGGRRDNGFLGDTWEGDGVTWTEVTPSRE